MPVWKVDSIDVQPVIELRCWRVYETERGERHFVGQSIASATGRVSSAIQKFDPESRTGITRSGRQYVLQGGPGYDADAMHVWSVWSMVNAVIEAKNVTAEYLPAADDGSDELAGQPIRGGPCLK